MSRFRLSFMGHSFELGPSEFFIGRGPDCQVAIKDPSVSRRHARLTATEDAVYIEDLGATGGVLVDGVRINVRARLKGGSRVTIASQVMTIIDTRGQGGPARGQGEGEPPIPDDVA